MRWDLSLALHFLQLVHKASTGLFRQASLLGCNTWRCKHQADSLGYFGSASSRISTRVTLGRRKKQGIQLQSLFSSLCNWQLSFFFFFFATLQLCQAKHNAGSPRVLTAHAFSWSVCLHCEESHIMRAWVRAMISTGCSCELQPSKQVEL